MSRPGRKPVNVPGPDGLMECRHCHQRKVPEMFRTVLDRRCGSERKLGVCLTCEPDVNKGYRLGRKKPNTIGSWTRAGQR